MKIRVMSDLHLDFENLLYERLDEDLTILAGDIWNGHFGIQWAHKNIDTKHVIMIPGNHEYYRKEFHTHRQFMRDEAARTDGHIIWLDDNTVKIDGINFIGSTLWTSMDQIGLDASGNRIVSDKDYLLAEAEKALNDFYVIKNGETTFTPRDAKALNHAAVEFISTELTANKNGKNVVITHHAPTLKSVHRKYMGDIINCCFVNDLDDLILKYQPNVWIHGHTHHSFDYMISDTRIVCNPKGYAKENAYQFNPELIIEV